MPSSSPLRIELVVEQALGHVTHGQNLRRLLGGDGLDVRFLPIEQDAGRWARVPIWSNWTVRAGIRARRATRAARRAHGDPDVRLVHTQVPAVLLGREMHRVPTVVSLDATPLQYDQLGEFYAHDVGPGWLEALKFRANRACFGRAAHLVVWAEWTKSSLVVDYGVPVDSVTVIPPGVDTERWQRSSPPPDDGVVRVLFVGGDLERKGGHDLLAAFGRLRARVGAQVELHLVTTSPVEPADGVVVHGSMTPNSPDLIDLYHRCHVFCLPTRGDCLPMVLPEAAAAGLAVIATDVGAISEIVTDGETGLLVPPADVDALAGALERLVGDADLRATLATAVHDRVAADHDAATNAARLAAVLRSVAG